MSNLTGFCLMYTYDVAVLDRAGKWGDAYTANRNQQSDDGELVMVTGVREGSVVDFYTYNDMTSYCFLNGWTQATDD